MAFPCKSCLVLRHLNDNIACRLAALKAALTPHIKEAIYNKEVIIFIRLFG